MMERVFRLSENGTSVTDEIIGGFSTFLTTVYILFVNGTILAEAGMPVGGVFVATALSSALCTLLVALYANVPFAMAPGMGVNALFAQTMCLSMGYHWREALAISIIACVLNAIIMLSPVRKSLVLALPKNIILAAGAGLGVFIANIGIRNANLVSYVSFPGQYTQTADQVIYADSRTALSFFQTFDKSQIILLIATVILIFLLVKEKKTGLSYGALPLSILVATFVGIPLSVGSMQHTKLLFGTSLVEFREVFMGFLGSPGIWTIFPDAATSLRTILLISVFSMTGLLDALGTVIGIGHIPDAAIFDEMDLDSFKNENRSSKLDRSLIAGAVGSGIAPLLGSSHAAIYLESATGVVSGARTGLSGVIVAIMFLICVPFGNFFNIIPIEAMSPALIFVGFCMWKRLQEIDWFNLEEAVPVFLILLIMPLTNSVIDGISIAIIFTVVLKLFKGEFKRIHPTHLLISAMYILVKVGENKL